MGGSRSGGNGDQWLVVSDRWLVYGRVPLWREQSRVGLTSRVSRLMSNREIIMNYALYKLREAALYFALSFQLEAFGSAKAAGSCHR